MRALILLALALPAYAGPPATHPFPWMSGERLLRQLDQPASQAEAAEAVAYLKGVMDATADRQWCYSTSKPGTNQMQPALTDKLRALTPSQARQSAGVLAVQAWAEKWPCPARGCCHG
nr:Rap1a/Tai family immunity protein [uncultured Massilia sp.]